MNRFGAICLGFFVIFSIGTLLAQDTDPENLEKLMEELFPGDMLISIEGAYENTSFCSESLSSDLLGDLFYVRNSIPVVQDSMDPEDYIDQHPVFIHLPVVDMQQPGVILPAIIIIGVIEPKQDILNIVPIIENAYSREISEPRADASFSTYRISDDGIFEHLQDFYFDSSGVALFQIEENYLVLERRLAFDFVARSRDGERVSVQGAAYNVDIPWHYTYLRLDPSGPSSLLALSGEAYTVTENNVIRVIKSAADDGVEYTFIIETSARINDNEILSSVPVVFTFTMVSEPINRAPYSAQQIIASEISINGQILEYDALDVNWPDQIIHMVEESESISGELRFVFGDRCDSNLTFQMLFRNIPLEENDS